MTSGVAIPAEVQVQAYEALRDALISGGMPSDLAAKGAQEFIRSAMKEQGWVTAGVAKGASDLGDPNPVEAEHVINQMRRNYPDKALKWMSGARWIGPVEVPHDRIDYDDKDSWAATGQPDRVQKFAKGIKAGTKHLHPVVAVQEPGDDKIKVIDGHHRTLAYQKLGRPVKAYVGFVKSDGGPWDETHSYQFHQGADPRNS